MSTKFTPGPWEKEDHRDKGDWRSAGPIWARNKGAGHPGTHICSMNWGRLYSESASEVIEEVEANANLIAASPKMHKALEIAEEALNNIDGDLLSRSANMEIHEALKAIHEALQQARGENV